MTLRTGTSEYRSEFTITAEFTRRAYAAFLDEIKRHGAVPKSAAVLACDAAGCNKIRIVWVAEFPDSGGEGTGESLDGKNHLGITESGTEGN